MAKILLACFRDGLNLSARRATIVAACERLTPDNVPATPPRIIEPNGVCIGVSSPNELIQVEGGSLAAGHLVNSPDWSRPGTHRPDGAYAVFRSDQTCVEIVSDALASRTVWYVLTDRMFAASTSQRALVMLLGSFEFNPNTVPWMLATGTLGPGHSWDRRLRWVPGASRVVLDRQSWTVKVHTEPVAFSPQSLPAAEHLHRITEAISRSVQAIDTDNPNLAITLSGGADCRTILCLLRRPAGLRAVTWGLRASRKDPTNDAYIAGQLAAHFGLRHQYFETDLAETGVEQIVDRFIANGEGRIDHLSGYVDGFALWSRLVDAGVHGIIRGDVSFGRPPAPTPIDVRHSAGMPLWSDFPGLPSLEHFGLEPQTIPHELQRRDSEPIDIWRDRLQQQYRAPFLLAALSDLKLPFVEILNPLIAGTVIDRVRELPEDLRTNKALLRRIAQQLSPGIPFATEVAIQAGDDILKSPQMVSLLRAGLKHGATESVIPGAFAEYVAAALNENGAQLPLGIRRTIRNTVKAWVPYRLRKLRKKPRVLAAPTPNRLAFRALVAIRAHEMFAKDADLDLASTVGQ